MAKRKGPCYMCGKQSTSKEHVPPQCFFPEDMRFNLMTVPSCPEHNEKTTKDDEYTRNYMTICYGNNAAASKQFENKVVKSFMNCDSLKKELAKCQKIYFNNDTTGEQKYTYAFEVETNRIESVIKKIAYALYYIEYKKIYNKNFTVSTKFFTNSDGSLTEKGEQINNIDNYYKTQEAIYGTTVFNNKGSNPEVFQYSFLHSPNSDNQNFIIKMTFYENCEFFVFAE